MYYEYKKTLTKVAVLILLYFLSCINVFASEKMEKQRVIILTDIEADPDDTQSMVRLLLYSNEIEIKGLVATTSTHMKNSIHPSTINKVIGSYEKVYLNLIKHDENYPTPEYLFSCVKKGLPVYGSKGVGNGCSSEGSELIIKELQINDDRPLWISVWGGANVLAQALYDIEKRFSKEIVNNLIDKIRVYSISDQDDTGILIRNRYPKLFYIVSPGGKYGSATWPGINDVIKGLNNENISNKWILENIQQNHGPLGAIYPDVSWSMEGDTPAFLSLIPNGLNMPDNPNFGGWGGRYELYIPNYNPGGENIGNVPDKPETRPIWTNASDSYYNYRYNSYGRSVIKDTLQFSGNRATIYRWREDFQNDFAARMDWCVSEYKNANHPPIVKLSHPTELNVISGEFCILDASETEDPDGDHLSFLWFPYMEAGTYKSDIKLNEPDNTYRVSFIAPKVERKETVHIIVKVTDSGTPKLSRYQRIIINIYPDSQSLKQK